MSNALGILSLILLAVGDVGMAVTGEWKMLGISIMYQAVVVYLAYNQKKSDDLLILQYQVLEKYREYTKQLEDKIND